uniref:fatty acid synthase-like n=1 Tax=Vespula vulgaris TaxID=7454 RepID=UPI00223BFB1B|nr:fatty acid synthase-like [Vespula vulgaris]
MENVKFNRTTLVPEVEKVEIIVMIQKGSGKFEVVEEGATIVTDKILLVISKETILSHIIKRNINKEEEELDGKDIYKELNLRGYQYNGLFRSIRSVSVSREKGHIQWKGNWVAFIDNIFQMKIFNLDTRDLFALIGIQKLVKDTNAYQQYLQSVTSTKKYIFLYNFSKISM